jgi:hypothetical protein
MTISSPINKYKTATEVRTIFPRNFMIICPIVSLNLIASKNLSWAIMPDHFSLLRILIC